MPPLLTSPELLMNSRENPFSSERIEKLPFRFRAGDSWDQFLERIKEQKYCGAIVGPHGSGKTTLLEELAPRLREQGFDPVIIRLSSESGMRDKERLPDILRPLAAPQFILLDGAEQLSTRHWLPVRSAATKAAGFIVTVHRVSRLPVLAHLETHVPLLRDLVAELTGGSLPQLEMESLIARHHGDIRGAFHELYERWDGTEAAEEEIPEAAG